MSNKYEAKHVYRISTLMSMHMMHTLHDIVVFLIKDVIIIFHNFLFKKVKENRDYR